MCKITRAQHRNVLSNIQFKSFYHPTRLTACAKGWQEQQVHSFAHDVKAVNNEVKDPHVILLSKDCCLHAISIISEQRDNTIL